MQFGEESKKIKIAVEKIVAVTQILINFPYPLLVLSINNKPAKRKIINMLAKRIIKAGIAEKL